MRGRGLKHRKFIGQGDCQKGSPPMRGRGLKLSILRAIPVPIWVAPHAGAWIETYDSLERYITLPRSPPMRGRGLKLIAGICINAFFRSPPMRGRGLKPITACIQQPLNDGSPPMRGRGLKLILVVKIAAVRWVAPHAGAWIETL